MEFQVMQVWKHPAPRPIPLYKTDWDCLRTAAMNHSNQITSLLSTAYNIKKIWSNFKHGFLQAIQEHIPPKNSNPKPSSAWINAEIKKHWFVNMTASTWDSRRQMTGNYRVRWRSWSMKSQGQHKGSIVDMLKPSSWMLMVHTGLPPRSSGLRSSWWEVETLRCPLLRRRAGLWPTLWTRQSYSTNSSSQFSAPQHSIPQKSSSWSANSTKTSNEIEITEAGVCKLLQNLNPHKACGSDGISPMVLRELADELGPALTLLYISSLRHDIILAGWRAAFVTSVFKDGEQ